MLCDTRWDNFEEDTGFSGLGEHRGEWERSMRLSLVMFCLYVRLVLLVIDRLILYLGVRRWFGVRVLRYHSYARIIVQARGLTKAMVRLE